MILIQFHLCANDESQQTASTVVQHQVKKLDLFIYVNFFVKHNLDYTSFIWLVFSNPAVKINVTRPLCLVESHKLDAA